MNAQTQPVGLAGTAANAGAPASGAASMFGNFAGGTPAMFAAQFPQNLLVRQEENLGLVRELVPPSNHIGLSIAPFLSVGSDDVVFDKVRGTSTGLAPARAEDAESALWTEDEMYSGRGFASVIDWALKNHYTASDVSTYREMLAVVEQVQNTDSFPLTMGSILDGFQAKVTRHTIGRRARLDNRIEWLITQALSTGKIVYDDGKISWSVDFARPADQHNQEPESGPYNSDSHDPINDILKVQELLYTRYGVTPRRAIVSRKFLNSLYKSSKFRVLTGFAPGTLTAADMQYALPGWGPNAAIETVKAETGLEFIENDAVYRTRANGSKTFVNNRFFPENQVIFLPDEADISAFDDTELGFAKTLTSPHPMGNWGTGFYTWERETTDPWGHDIGTGIKAFPVFPHMELTYTWNVTL